jgi:hypothetical protein
MNTKFYGLVPESRESWQDAIADAQQLPVCGDTEETLLKAPPDWCRVENQGPINSCSANAMTSIAEKIEYIHKKKPIQLSRWFQYIKSEEFTGTPGRDQGATLSAALRVGVEVGFVPEDQCQYPKQYDRNRLRFSQELYKEAEQRRIKSKIDLSKGYSAWRTLLGQDIGAVLLGTFWPVQIDARGYAYNVPTSGGGHAIAALFLADTFDANGRPDVWIVNSHDKSFGLQGWFKATASWVEQLQGRDYFGNVGVSDMSVPGPRKVDWTKRTMIG